jgi:ubiquinone/menaquinone biosynthesis C-methylase UbiE
MLAAGVDMISAVKHQKKGYKDYVDDLLKHYPYDVAIQHAVGVDFEQNGILQKCLLTHLGLDASHYLIDVGCGAGRLARQLQSTHKARYLGLDIVPELIEYARGITDRKDWRFEVVDGLTIPEEDNVADVVCFFSVLTHLLHEESFLYLQEAKRVLRPGGAIVFSFLEYSIHTDVFERTVADVGVDAYPLNVFIDRSAIQVWAKLLGLSVVRLIPGDSKIIPLDEPLEFESGFTMTSPAHFGQSVCVLIKGDERDLG